MEKTMPQEIAQPPVYSIEDFCRAFRIGRSKLYQLWEQDKGPRTVKIGTRVLISADAAQEWLSSREAETASKAA